MNIKTTTPRRLAMALTALSLLLPVGALAQDTGWLQTDGGTYDYNDPVNWVDGVINGVWDASLTTAGQQYVRFEGETVLPAGLTFLHSGNNVRLDPAPDGNHTIVLMGDILHRAHERTVGFEGANRLSVDLGDSTRLFDIRRAMYISDVKIDNGGIAWQGGAEVNLWRPALTLDEMITRNIQLLLRDTTSISIDGSLTIDGMSTDHAAGYAGGITVLIFYSTSQLSADRLDRVNGGIVKFAGTLGTGSNASATFDEAPTLFGGGGTAGTTTVSILPWAVGTADTGDGQATTFITYDTHGIRLLDVDTEFATDPVTADPTDNVRMLNTSVSLDEDRTVNSLFMHGTGSEKIELLGEGTLTVTSGAVFLRSHDGRGAIDANLNFGDAQGRLGYVRGKGTDLNGAISGTQGVVFYQAQRDTANWSAGTGISLGGSTGNSTYTGDTYIHGRVTTNHGFLPSGSRTGDVYQNGILHVHNTTINGLNGTGLITRRWSSSNLFTIGDNDADGHFSGRIIDPHGVRKIGTGTQVFSGPNTYTGATTVNGGTLVIDGSITSAATVQAGATLRGAGTINRTGNAITVQSGATLAPGSTDGFGTMTVLQGGVAFADGALMAYTIGTAGHGALSVEGSVTGSVEIPITFEGEGAGKWKILEAASIDPTFVSTTGGVKLTLENGGTELWAESLPKGTVILLL